MDKFIRAFEKAMSEFADDLEFFSYLFQARLKEGVGCIFCGSKDFQFQAPRHIICMRCKRRSSVTSGTPFEDMRHCRIMMAVIRVKEKRVEFNPFWLAKVAKISYSTASDMFRRVSLIYIEHLQPSDSTMHCAHVADVLFRRSRESMPDLHPTSSLLDIEADSDQQTGSARNAEVDRNEKLLASRPEAAKQIYRFLSEGPLLADAIMEKLQMSLAETALHLFELEIDGLIKRLPGDRYEILSSSNGTISEIRNSSDSPAWAAKFLDYCRKYFQGVSRKYLQAFIALFWFERKGIKWGKNGLFKAVIRHPPITHRKIIAFASPMVLPVPA